MKSKFEKSIVSLIISSFLVFLIKEPILSISILGNTLSARNFYIQSAFLTLMVILAALVIFFVFNRQVAWLLRNFPFSLAIISLIPLICYFMMGSFSRFVADDYISAAGAISKGIYQAAAEMYVSWSGRFTASFFDSLVGYIGVGIIPYITGGAIVVWILALLSILKHFFRDASPLNRWACSLIISSFILITTFETTPQIDQSLYWGQGMRSLILPLIMATALVSILYDRIFIKKSSPVAWFLIVGLLSFIAGGFGETYVVLQTSALALFLFLAFLENQESWYKRVLPLITTGLLTSILAMVITIIAPGNKFRQAFFPPPPDIFNLIRISVVSFGDYLRNIFMSPYHLFVLIALFLLSLSLGSIQPDRELLTDISKNKYRISHFIRHSYLKSFLFISSITLILLLVCFVPSAYGMSTHPSERTMVIPTFLMSISIFSVGLVAGKHLKTPIQSFIQNKILFRYLRLSAWLIFLLFSGYTLVVSNQILAKLPEYRHFAEVFDIAESTIRDAKSEGKETVSIRLVRNLFNLDDFGNGTDWIHTAVNTYYGIPVKVNWIK